MGTRCKRVAAISLALIALVWFSCISAAAGDLSRLEETTTDLLGMAAKTMPGQAQGVIDAGARVVNLVGPETFFLVWIPPGYSDADPKRVMVVLHGSEGSAYAAIDAELENVTEQGYALVAVQWWRGNGPADYFSPRETYGLIDLALRYVAQTYGVDPQRSALVAFSMAASRSYEITYWDRALGNGYFALTIAHAGGIPVESPMPFVTRLLGGEFGETPFAGTHFFLYCGALDEEWGAESCARMRNAEAIVTQYGAVIERFIEDPEGGHQGYRLNPEWHAAGVETFLRLTGD